MSKTATLGEIFHLQMGKTPSRTNEAYWNGTHRWISIADLGSYEKYTGKTKECITDKAAEDSGIHLVPKNTVIMSFKLSLGKTAITSEDIYTNEAIMAFIPTGNYPVSVDYFYHFCKNRNWTAETNRAVLGATLNKTALAAVKINLPDIEEQKKIADKLNKTEELITMHREYLAQLQQYLDAAFAERFGNGNAAHHPLHRFCHFIDYRGKTPEKAETGIPLVTAKNVRNHEFAAEPLAYIPAENYDAVMTRGIPQVNDVLFTTEAPLGNVCRIPALWERFCIGQRIVVLQTDTAHLLPEYLEYALTTPEFREQVWQQSSGSTVKGIRKKLLENLMIPVPPLKEQAQFAGIVMQAERLKAAAKNALTELETLKKSLVQEFFE